MTRVVRVVARAAAVGHPAPARGRNRERWDGRRAAGPRAATAGHATGRPCRRAGRWAAVPRVVPGAARAAAAAAGPPSAARGGPEGGTS